MNNDDKKNNFPKKENFSASPNQKPLNNDFQRQKYQPNSQINQPRNFNNQINRGNSLNNRENSLNNRENSLNNHRGNIPNKNQGNPQSKTNSKNGFSDKVRQKAVKEGAKIAADSVAGPAGGQAVEALSKTKVGQKMINAAADNMKNPFKRPSISKLFSSKNEDEVDGEGEFNADLDKKIITFFGIGTLTISGCFTALIILAIISLIISPLFYINEMFGNITSAISVFTEKLGNLLLFRGWCTDLECDEKEENDFYEKVEEVYQEYKGNPYYVTLNTNLITATLTYSDPFSTTAGTDDEASSIYDLIPSNYVNFKKSQKKVDLLATKMVSHCCYENGAEYEAPNGKHMCEGSDGKDYDDIVYNCPEDIIDEETGEVLVDYSESYKLDTERYREYLEDEFIRKFYYDNTQSEETQSDIKRVVDEIFLRVAFYEDISSSKNYAKVYGFCSGITVVDGDGNPIGTYSLDEYVAGVISGEAWPGQNMEAYKAQAIAARTFALYRTNNCSTTIDSSDSSQVFDPDIEDYALEAANATSGQVLIYNDEIFSSQYDSFCYNDSDCVYGEENGKYYVEYTKLPTEEKHKVYLSKDYLKYANGGHGRGMSQVVSYEMADNGATYEEILKYFYSTGVSITNMITFVDGSHISTSQIIKDKDELSARADLYKQLGTVFLDGMAIDLSRIYSKSASNLGQCVWYAKSRALELIYFSNLDNTQKVKAFSDSSKW